MKERQTGHKSLELERERESRQPDDKLDNLELRELNVLRVC